jgi:nicotinamide riboside transporter PnuC
MKGFRGVLAATLVLEAIVVLLTLLVLIKFGDTGGWVGVTAVLTLAVAMIVTVRYAGRPWALWVAVGLQGVMILCGFITFALAMLGVLFGLVWFALLMMRRDVRRKMERGELPSQQL